MPEIERIEAVPLFVSEYLNLTILRVAGMHKFLIEDKCDRLKNTAYRVGKLVAISPGNHLEGIETCLFLHRNGIASTLGKFSRKGDDPARIVYEYKRASNLIDSHSIDGPFYLSLKPPALDFNIDHTAAIAVNAFRNGHAINFDSHDYHLAEPTIALLKQLIDRIGSSLAARAKWRYCLTLPSRWKRSVADARWVAEKGLRARLVKGEFKAMRQSDEMDPAKGFLELADLLAGRIPEIAVATHDYQLAREVIGRIKKTDSAVQLELVFGMPTTRMISLSKQMDIPVRLYVPYGENLFLYGVRQFLTNPQKLLRPNFPEVFARSRNKLLRIVNSLAAAK